METRESHEPQTVTPVPPRRPFFRWVTAGLATVAAALVALPSSRMSCGPETHGCSGSTWEQ